MDRCDFTRIVFFLLSFFLSFIIVNIRANLHSRRISNIEYRACKNFRIYLKIVSIEIRSFCSERGTRLGWEEEGLESSEEDQQSVSLIPSMGGRARVSRCFTDGIRNAGEGGWLRCIRRRSRKHDGRAMSRQLPGKLCNAAIYLGQIDNL